MVPAELMVRDAVNVHSPSQREGVGGSENPDRAGMDSLALLPTSPLEGERTERLRPTYLAT
jgi:hypothetical protein